MFSIFIFEIVNDDEAKANPKYIAISSPCFYMKCLCQMTIASRLESFRMISDLF